MIKKIDAYPKWFSFRNTVLFILASLSYPRSDAMSGMGEFYFVNPGVTLTKVGPGFELSAGKNGVGGGGSALLLGALGRYQPEDNRTEAGVEFGVVAFLLEAGMTFSDKGPGAFFAPDLCIPIPSSKDHDKGLVFNLFYRVYPAEKGGNTFGGSLKVAWTRQ